MERGFKKMAHKCPQFESIRSAQGIMGSAEGTRTVAPRCDHCVHWIGGSCDLFLAR